MEKEDFFKIFERELAKINIKAESKKIDQFYFYMKELLKWNKKINVTSITDENEFIIKHYIDSLTINKYVNEKNNVIDIGTGGGFPGIPLKILNEDVEVTLIDSINKKLNVIKNISGELKLEKLEIIHTRAEDLAHNNKYREQYDIAVTRAVAGISTIVEYMMPFVKVGGYAICMKGPGYLEEINEAKKAIEILGGKIEKIDRYLLDDIERNNIIIKKVIEIPTQYPRKNGKPSREPIR